jgi:hypothetical protein
VPGVAAEITKAIVRLRARPRKSEATA